MKTAVQPNVSPLAFCNDCGKEISPSAPICLHCGRVFKTAPRRARQPVTTPKPMGSMAKMALAVIIGTFVAVWVGVLIKEAMAAPARRQALEAAADAAAAAKRSEAWQRGKEFAGYRLEKFKPVFPESDRALGCGAEGDGDGLYRTWGYLDGHDPLSNAPGRKSWEAVVKPVVGYAGHWQLKSLKVDGETIVQ